MSHLISVVIPTLNRPQMLTRAIKSVINQTYSNLEIFIVNDGGTDLTDLIASLKDSRLVYFQNQLSKGPSAARNLALKQSRGKYISYLDDDDFFYPNHLEILCTALQEGAYQAAFTDGNYDFHHNENGSVVTDKKSRFSFSLEFPSLLVDNHVPPICVMHARDCLDQVGYFDETLSRHEDWDLWIRIAAKYSFLHIPEATVEYSRYDEGERTQSLSDWKGFFLNTMQIIHYRYRDLAKPYPGLAQTQFQNRSCLRRYAYEQLELMPEERLRKLNLDKIMSEIVEGSLLLTKEDIQETYILTRLACSFLEDHPILWMLHAKLCRILGNYSQAREMMAEAVRLSPSPEILQELLILFEQTGDHQHAQEVRDYLKQVSSPNVPD